MHMLPCMQADACCRCAGCCATGHFSPPHTPQRSAGHTTPRHHPAPCIPRPSQASLFEWVRENYGTSADLVTEELIGGVTHANYGQTNVEVNALAGERGWCLVCLWCVWSVSLCGCVIGGRAGVHYSPDFMLSCAALLPHAAFPVPPCCAPGLVSLLPATDPQVLRVVGGNGRLAPAVLAAANATVHCPATVTAVRRRADGRYEVVLQSSNGGGAAVQAPEQQQGQALAELQEQPFDAVIIATPLEGSGISLEGVDPPFIPARKYQQASGVEWSLLGGACIKGANGHGWEVCPSYTAACALFYKLLSASCPTLSDP